MTNQAVLKQDQKNKQFYYLYLKNVPVVYASVIQPKKKYQSDDTHWVLTAFVNDETRAYLEEEVLLNKELHKVGVDKNKKKKIKYTLSTQRDDENAVYDPYENLNGISLTLNTKRKNGEPNHLIVVDKNGEEFNELVGNGSVCNIKCFGYRNQDDLLVIALNIVQVLEHVPYEGTGGIVEDEELGIKVDMSKYYSDKEHVEKVADTVSTDNDDFDDDIPF